MIECRWFQLVDGAKQPKGYYEKPAGYDLFALEPTTIHPGETKLVPTGIGLILPDNLFGLILGRSGVQSKGLIIHPGVIDPDYRGQVHIIASNISGEPFVVEKGMRIAQLIVLPRTELKWVQATGFSLTERGFRGIGSTGL